MVSEWVGRAGILAEIVSFFLIAPEIAGPERLKGLEAALERWLGRVDPTSDAVRLPVVVPVAIAVGLGEIFLIAWLSPDSFRAAGTLTAAGVLGGAIVAGSWLSNRMPAAVRAVRRILEGEARLRALVFGTGVVLLFGGLGAQFYATF
jgi:hypothetical protein